MQNTLEKIKYLFYYFLSPKEIIVLFTLFIFSLIFFILFLKTGLEHFMTERIAYAGNITEGVIGTPKNTDPFSADSEIDNQINSLLYTSLFEKINSNNFAKKYEPKLASKVEISNDQTTYKITLRGNIFFSDGSPIKSEDVIYSLESSPIERNFEITQNSDSVITLKLDKADKNFLEKLTFPIVKKDYVFEKNFSTELVTSSSFKIVDSQTDSDGNLTFLSLKRYDNGEAKLPYLKYYNLKYFNNEVEAYSSLQKNEIDILTGVSGNNLAKIKDDFRFQFSTSTLPNHYSIFLNQNKNTNLQDKTLRALLAESLDRKNMVNFALGGYGFPQKDIVGNQENQKNIEDLKKKLGSSFSFKDGVLYISTKNATNTDVVPVTIKLTTLENAELIETSKYIQNTWQKLGIKTELEIVSKKDLTNTLKDRDFEALLFGFSIYSEKDYSAFFSSKERTYPKLNIANYTSKQVDKILNVLTGDNSPERIKDLVNQLSIEIKEDNPIIMLYKPMFVFVHLNTLKIQLPEQIHSEKDRYIFVENWYTKTEKVFPFFEKSNFVDYLDTWVN